METKKTRKDYIDRSGKFPRSEWEAFGTRGSISTETEWEEKLLPWLVFIGAIAVVIFVLKVDI